MERILLIILLYVIFGVVGPLIKRMQRRQQQQQLPSNPPATSSEVQRTPQQKGEANVDKHFTRLQDAFQQPPELPSARQEAQSASSEETALELLPLPLQTEPRVSTTYRPPAARRKTAPSALQKKTSLLGFDRRRGYMQGIVMAEILGLPVSKRR